MGHRSGSLIGAIGGVLFVVINAGDLPTPLRLPVRIAGVVVFVAVVAYVIVRSPRRPREAQPSARSMRTYLVCVVAEVIAIPVGSTLLVRVLHQPVLTPVWVVLIVGVHFVPFARAFDAPLFAVLGVTLIVIALVGGVAAVEVGAVAAGWAGVAAGATLLGFACAGARRSAEP